MEIHSRCSFNNMFNDVTSFRFFRHAPLRLDMLQNRYRHASNRAGHASNRYNMLQTRDNMRQLRVCGSLVNPEITPVPRNILFPPIPFTPKTDGCKTEYRGVLLWVRGLINQSERILILGLESLIEIIF